MNSQQLILERIKVEIETNHNVVLVQDREYANTGTLRTLDADTFGHIASVEYDFQHSYVHFGPMSERVAALWYGVSAEDKAPWVKGSVPELVDVVVAYLTKKT